MRALISIIIGLTTTSDATPIIVAAWYQSTAQTMSLIDSLAFEDILQSIIIRDAYDSQFISNLDQIICSDIQ